MTITTLQVQGADAAKKTVPLDTPTGQTYSAPIQKIAFGAVGALALVSEDNPLPVSSSNPQGAATSANQITSNEILASIDTVLETWNESDRCKVSLVPGQAGVSAAKGNANAATIRVVTAADDDTVIYLNTLTGATGSDGINRAPEGQLGMVIMGIATSDKVDDGDAGCLAMTTARELKIVSQPLSVAVARGLINGVTQINKFGAAPSGVQTTPTDIWSRANATPTQQIWIAPTAARIHALVSTSANDDGDTQDVGAWTIRVYGLTSWDTAETSEVVLLTGVTPVNTLNSYVIIHRMKVLTCGASGPNVGTISATAVDDGTVTAVILPGDGQTEMAIYGVPSTQTFILTRWGVGIDKASPTATTCDFELRVNENPNVQLLSFLRKDDMAVQSTGNQWQERTYGNPVPFSGPCIIKVQATASAADTDAKSGFDGYLVTK